MDKAGNWFDVPIHFYFFFLQETEKTRGVREMKDQLISSAYCDLTTFSLNLYVCFLQETEKARAVREMEERLISSAFYNLSMQMHRSTVEARLSNIHSTSSPHGQSFLARQR